MIILNIGTSSYRLKQLSHIDLLFRIESKDFTLVDIYTESVDYFVIHEPYGGGFKMKLYHCLEFCLPLIMDGNSASALEGFYEDIHYTTLEKAQFLTKEERVKLQRNLSEYVRVHLTRSRFENTLRRKVYSLGE